MDWLPLPVPDLTWLACAAVVAGLVRGFSGFGTALVYVPLAAQVLPPVWVVVTLTAMDLLGPLPLVPRALRDGRLRDVGVTLGAAAVTVWAGLALLGRLPERPFLLVVSAVALGLAALLASGWRYRGTLTAPILAGSGGLGGFLGGLTGLAGPPVILAQVASMQAAAVTRANVLLYLVGIDVLMMLALGARGMLTLEAVLLGLALVLPYGGAAWVGGRLFDPGRERLWRGVAYGVIAASGLSGLWAAL
ncbi:TSUP family transporter [Jannaschia sp. Os4]|uniref:TSUP family transporter n=1 Tax=Jannaschia sp. Os4 TaxID=2807617 RepID=UPI001939EB2D|nr:TSUP family transporter [Jannaschia sp. Os4]MBM2574972.1 TSUP family transporter [Jannaschia sp. Os4]